MSQVRGKFDYNVTKYAISDARTLHKSKKKHALTNDDSLSVPTHSPA